MQRQNNAPAIGLEEESFWSELEEECIAALPSLHLRSSHNETDIFYADEDYNNNELEPQIPDASHSPAVKTEPAKQEEAVPAKKRKRMYGQIGSRELGFLGISNPLEEIHKKADNKIKKELKLFGKNNQFPAKKACLDEFKKTFSK